MIKFKCVLFILLFSLVGCYTGTTVETNTDGSILVSNDGGSYTVTIIKIDNYKFAIAIGVRGVAITQVK